MTVNGIFSGGRLVKESHLIKTEDFTWEMDIDILSSEVKTRKYTYFGTYFTHENYHRRLANRKLPMEKPNNGWVLQGWYHN